MAAVNRERNGFRCHPRLGPRPRDGLPLQPGNTKGVVPALLELANGGFQQPPLGDPGYPGEQPARPVTGSVSPSRRLPVTGTDGPSPASVGWWNITFERSKEHRIVLDETTFISILVRRLTRPEPTNSFRATITRWTLVLMESQNSSPSHVSAPSRRRPRNWVSPNQQWGARIEVGSAFDRQTAASQNPPPDPDARW
jgi:hypothetical protein